MLINADDKKYPEPVIGNIIPTYPQITESKFLHWLSDKSFRAGRPKSKKVIIAGMEPEKQSDSHRKSRLDFMIRMVKTAGLIPEPYHLPNYGFENALSLWQSHKDVYCYICLSDQMAVALQHILIANKQPYHNRIVGFDNSHLSQKENVPSFGQELENFGRLAIKRFLEVFEHMKVDKNYQFQCEKILAEVLFFDRVID